GQQRPVSRAVEHHEHGRGGDASAKVRLAPTPQPALAPLVVVEVAQHREAGRAADAAEAPHKSSRRLIFLVLADQEPSRQLSHEDALKRADVRSTLDETSLPVTGLSMSCQTAS